MRSALGDGALGTIVKNSGIFGMNTMPGMGSLPGSQNSPGTLINYWLMKLALNIFDGSVETINNVLRFLGIALF